MVLLVRCSPCSQGSRSHRQEEMNAGTRLKEGEALEQGFCDAEGGD